MGQFFWRRFFGGIFWEKCFGSIFWEDFLGGFFWKDYLGGFFGEEFSGRNSLCALELTCISRFWFLSRFWGNGRKEVEFSILRSAIASSSHLFVTEEIPITVSWRAPTFKEAWPNPYHYCT